MTDTFIQRPTPEPITAFRANLSGDDIDEVFGAFGLTSDVDFTLNQRDGKYRLSFQRPSPSPQFSSTGGGGTVGIVDGYTFNLVTTTDSGGTVAVNEGDWVVTRYGDTDYPDVFVVGDKDFQRRYKAGADKSWVEQYFDSLTGLL